MKTTFENLDAIQVLGKAQIYATNKHSEVNHKYGNGVDYSVHLQMVVDYANKYRHLLDVSDAEFKIVLAACWTHDLIEDCRQTYNDVKRICGEKVADITYALTNEKGKNRKERANDKYYTGIRNVPHADFVKICDRLANVKYSFDNKSSMLDAYKKEQYNFWQELFEEHYAEMGSGTV